MRRVRQGGRIGTVKGGLVAIVITAIALYLAWSKDVPFTRPFEVTAVFQNAPPLSNRTVVRIAGVDVGKVGAIETVDGNSPAVKVTLKLDDEALPIHSDAELRVRPRLLFEGNFFLDLKPGTPDAGLLEDGDTIPASRTFAPVQIDQVLGTLQTDTRTNLQSLLVGAGAALGGEPEPGEDDDQDPSTQGETAGESLNDALEYSADSLRGAAIVADAAAGTEPQDLSKLVSAQELITGALSSREGQLADLITNLNTTMGALAAEQARLGETVRLLPRVLEAANPALDRLNRAFPSTRAWAREMIPALREAPATLDAAGPWTAQTRALLSFDELQGLVAELEPAVRDSSRFLQGQLDLLPQVDLLDRCLSEVVLPTAEQRIDEGALSTGLSNHQELWQALVGVAGMLQNFDGNGPYARVHAGGAYPTETPPVGNVGPLHSSAGEPPLGTRPARTPKAPYRRGYACHRNPAPDLNAAKTGAGP